MTPLDLNKKEQCMTETSQRNILGPYRSVMEIHARVQRDQEMLKHMETHLQQLIHQGATTDDPMLDLILHYGLPCHTGYLEQNLRRLDEQLKQCAGEFILIELITPQIGQPARHQTVAGVIATDRPTMRYVDEEGKFSGVEIAVISRRRILLSEDVLTQYRQEDRQDLDALLNSGTAFSIFIGHEAVTNYLLPTYISKSIPEERKTREARTKLIVRELNDLMIGHDMFLDEDHAVLSRILTDQYTEDITID